MPLAAFDETSKNVRCGNSLQETPVKLKSLNGTKNNQLPRLARRPDIITLFLLQPNSVRSDVTHGTQRSGSSSKVQGKYKVVRSSGMMPMQTQLT